MGVEQLVTRYDHVLVAFDGPIAELPSRGSAAERLRVMVADGRLPRRVACTDDPMVVVDYAATIGPATEHAVRTQLRRIEYELVAGGAPTPGVPEACAALAAAGTQISVISGLSADATRTFLVLHGLREHVRHLTGGAVTTERIASAIHERAIPSASCVFVGSTDTDLAAARATGVDTIRYRRPNGPAATEPTSQPWFDALSTQAAS
jgi:phosphoglycolate phosphatase-like HAD superfamily hydrolase